MSKRITLVSATVVALVTAMTVALLVSTGAFGQGGESGGGFSGSPEKAAVEATARAMQLTAEAYPTAPVRPGPIETPPALPTPRVAGPDVRPCQAKDLTAVADEGAAATGGEGFVVVTIGNESDTACRLAGPPGFQFVDSAGKVANNVERSEDSPACSSERDFPCVFSKPLLMLPELPVPSPAQLKSEPIPTEPGQAVLSIGVWTPGGHMCSGPATEISAIDLSLPEGGGKLRVELSPELFRYGTLDLCRVTLFDFNGVASGPETPTPSPTPSQPETPVPSPTACPETPTPSPAPATAE
jgi:cell division septation protein DedD